MEQLIEEALEQVNEAIRIWAKGEGYYDCETAEEVSYKVGQ